MSEAKPVVTLDPEDRRVLAEAVATLENPSLAVRITNLLGNPIESGLRALPDRMRSGVEKTTQTALDRAFRMAVGTMSSGRRPAPSNRAHQVLATVSGGVGGAFGLPALAIELPMSTAIILRSIADIARSEGEEIRTTTTQLACLEVFALGGRSEADDSAETAYYATRAALASAVSEAAKHIARRGLAEEGAPAIVRLIAVVAARFSIPVSEKLAAQAVPVVGAAGGAAVNLLFINHFQDMARGHFTVRRLERKYGASAVREAYRWLKVGSSL